MSFKVENLEGVLFRLGHLVKRELILVVWTDTDKDCKPIANLVGITFPKSIKDESARDIIRGINSKTWILAIIDDHKNVYQIISAQEFAEKSCEEKEILILKEKSDTKKHLKKKEKE